MTKTTEVFPRENEGVIFQADDYRQLIQSVTRGREGIVNIGDFALSAGTGLQTVVAAGHAFVQRDTPAGHGMYHFYRTNTKTLTHDAAHATNARYDAVVIDITDTELGDGADNDPDTAIHLIKGIEDGTHVKPAIPANVYRLGYVNIPATATSLNAGSYSDAPVLYDTLEWAVAISGDSLGLPNDNSWHTLIGFDASEDPFGMWDDANNQYVIPAGRDGVYLIEGMMRVHIGGAGVDTPISLSFLRNGSGRLTLQGPSVRAAADDIVIGGTHVHRLAAGDTIKLEYQMGNGSSNPETGVVAFAPLNGAHAFRITKLGR